MSDMTPRKTFIIIVFDVNQTFFFYLLGNAMYVIPINGLKTEIFTY